MQRFILVLPCLLSLTGCLPLAAWSADGYTVDNSRSKDGRAVVGRCYRLLVDANVVADPREITLRGGSAVKEDGYLRIAENGAPNLPKGSTIVVERTLLWRNIESSNMKPYVRVGGHLIDAATLFQDGASSEHRLWYIDRLLEPCDPLPSR